LLAGAVPTSVGYRVHCDDSVKAKTLVFPSLDIFASDASEFLLASKVLEMLIRLDDVVVDFVVDILCAVVLGRAIHDVEYFR